MVKDFAATDKIDFCVEICKFQQFFSHLSPPLSLSFVIGLYLLQLIQPGSGRARIGSVNTLASKIYDNDSFVSFNL